MSCRARPDRSSATRAARAAISAAVSAPCAATVTEMTSLERTTAGSVRPASIASAVDMAGGSHIPAPSM